MKLKNEKGIEERERERENFKKKRRKERKVLCELESQKFLKFARTKREFYRQRERETS